MKRYFTDSMSVVRFVNAQLQNLDYGSALTMTITQEKSADYSVQIVTDASSEDIELQTAKFFSETQVNT